MINTFHKKLHNSPKKTDLIVYSIILTIFVFFLLISFTFAANPKFHKYSNYPKNPHYRPYYKATENTRVIPIKLPLNEVPKEISLDFSNESTYFYISKWKGLQLTPYGAKLKHKTRTGMKAYIPYVDSGSFTLDDLKLNNFGLIYAVEINYDASIPKGTNISFKVNGTTYNGIVFLGKTNTATIEAELSSEKDYLSPLLKSLDITLYPLKTIQINPIVLQTFENTLQADLKDYIIYYDFGYPNLVYSVDGKNGCSVSGSILNCSNLSQGTFYENLTITDKITNAKASAPIQIIVNSSAPYFTNLPEINVLEDSKIDPINLEPYIQDPNNPVSELTLSIDYIAPANGLNCYIDSKILYCSLELNVYGNFSVALKAEDPQGNTANGEVLIKVQNVNDAPSWEEIPAYSLEAGQTLSLDLANFVSDIDTPASSLGFTIKSSEFMVCNLDKSLITCNPTKTPVSTTLVVAVSDGEFEVEKSIPVSWYIPNQPPIFSGTIVGKTATITDLSYTLDLSKYFTDPEGSKLTYSYAVLSGPANCNLQNSILNCFLSSQGYSDIKVSASDGEKETYSNVFRLAKVAPTDLTATADVPHTVPTDYTVYFQVYVTNNLNIYLEGIEVTVSSPELTIFNGVSKGHNTITEILPKIEPNTTVESKFHTTVGNIEKIYKINIMLNGQQLDSKEIETKSPFYTAGNYLIDIWDDQGSNDGEGYFGTGDIGEFPANNKLKIRVHITNFYDVPIDANLCYYSIYNVLQPIENGQIIDTTFYCKPVNLPALEEIVYIQELMPVDGNYEEQRFILGLGNLQPTGSPNLINGTPFAEYTFKQLPENLTGLFDYSLMPYESVLQKNKTYNGAFQIWNGWAVPLYNFKITLGFGAPQTALGSNDYAYFDNPEYTFDYIPLRTSAGCGKSEWKQFTLHTKSLSADPFVIAVFYDNTNKWIIAENYSIK